jgi:hypothetical protein
MNGTVIGGVSDLGAVYYNPGRLAQLERPGFLLTAEAFEVNHVEVRLGGGEKSQIEQSSFRGVPSLVAGMFTVPSLPGHRFAYSFLTRRRSDSDLLFTTDYRGELFPDHPGEETYTGTWESVSKLDENWVGFSWAFQLSPRLSLGVSTFGTYVGRKRRVEVDHRALTSAGDVTTLSRLREYRFRSYGLLWKAGLAADLAPLRLGLSVTTPEITAFGSGSIRYEDLSIPLESSSGSQPSDGMVVFKGEGFAVKNRSPFSVGGGISWIGPRTEIHLGGEWYSGVAPYRITGTDSIRSQSSGSLLEYHVVDELKPVFNFGAGIEWQVSDAFSAYGSLIRDASAAAKNLYRPTSFGPQVSNSASRADGFYLGAGVSFEARWIDLTAGVTYGAISESMKNPLTGEVLGPGQTFPIVDRIETIRQRWRILLGFTIPMVQAVADDPGVR